MMTTTTAAKTAFNQPGRAQSCREQKELSLITKKATGDWQTQKKPHCLAVKSVPKERIKERPKGLIFVKVPLQIHFSK